MKVPLGYKMVSFDVATLFTNTPLDTTFKIILKRVMRRNK